jgi:hypothetical protein
MSENKDIDAEIAVRLFGWRAEPHPLGSWYYKPDSPRFPFSFCPSTDPADSRKVIDELKRRKFDLEILATCDKGSFVGVFKDGDRVAYGVDEESIDVAVCKAALAALTNAREVPHPTN